MSTRRFVPVVSFVASLAFVACSSDGEEVANPPSGGGSGGSGGTLGDGSAATGGALDASQEAPACAVASDEAVPSPVDVIITIDQSASMIEETEGVKANLNTNLVDILAASGIDYQVIFVTGAADLPTGPEFFQAPANVNSSDPLTLLLWTYDGFNKSPNTCDQTADPDVKWGDKLRPEGVKVFIALTDDDPSSFDCAYATNDCTPPTDCSGCANNCEGYCPQHQCPTYADQPAAWGGGTFPEELYNLQPAGMFGTPASPKWVFHAIVPVLQQLDPTQPVTPLNEVCNVNGNSGETSGVEYQKLATLTGGMRFPSCNTDYSPVFQEIASTIVPLACAFKLESTNLGTIDPNKTNVSFDPGDGSPEETILKDDTAPCDGGADGWQFTNNDETIVLCGPACERLKSSATGRVSITVGCDTQIRPPR